MMKAEIPPKSLQHVIVYTTWSERVVDRESDRPRMWSHLDTLLLRKMTSMNWVFRTSSKSSEDKTLKL